MKIQGGRLASVNKLRICLINAYPLKEMGIVGQIYPPLGILYLASYARSQFNNLDFLVLDGYKIKKTVFYEKIYKYNPDILGISFTTQSSTGAYEIINKLKSYYQDKVLIIAGGPHPSIGAEEVFEKSLIDYVVRGEGEIVFSDIIRCCIAGRKNEIKKLTSVSFKQDGHVVNNSLRPLIKDISSLPFPARDLVNIYEYPGYHYKKLRKDTSIVSTRGCPFDCVYCSNPVWKLQKPWYRTRSPKNIADEIEFIIKRYNVREFYDQTDEFNGDLKWAKTVCDEFCARNLNIAWKVQMRADNIDNELAEKMRRSGCWLGFLGIETCNDETTRGVNKNILKEQSVKALHILKQNNIKTFALLMAFNVWEENCVLKFENKEKTMNTVKFAEDLVRRGLIDLISWSLTTPYPGSKLFQIAEKHKLIPEELRGKWENWDSSANFIMRLPGIKKNDWLDVQRRGKILQAKLLFKSGTFNMISLPIYIKKMYKLFVKYASSIVGGA